MIDGKYTAFGNMAGNPVPCMVNLHTDGTKLTGTAFFMGEMKEIEYGTVTGNDFRFYTWVTIPIGNIFVKFKGTANDGKIRFSVKTPMGEVVFNGQRG